MDVDINYEKSKRVKGKEESKQPASKLIEMRVIQLFRKYIPSVIFQCHEMS